MLNKVGKYYDETYKSYSLGWSREHLHHGIWDEDTKSHAESLINTIDYLSEALEINSEDIILDAGCGVGGASRYIVKNFGCQVVGITNSKVLFEVAEKSISEIEDGSKLKFYLMDYENTNFEENSFTKIFAIESVCYAEDKANFAEEAMRLLKSGGKLLIPDGYRLKDELNPQETIMYQDWLEGWALDDLAAPKRFQQSLKKLGFKNIKYIDHTTKISKSLAYMNRNAKYTRRLYYILYKLRIIKKSVYLSAKSAYLAKIVVDKGIIGYGFLYAEKA